MATIKRKPNGKIITKNGRVSCECCNDICSLQLNSAGGDEGFDQTYSGTITAEEGQNIYMTFEAYRIRDILEVYLNGSQVINTGCQRSFSSHNFTIPQGPYSVRIKVIPGWIGCRDERGTAWVLTSFCDGGSSGEGIGLSLL
jgi:hypothetical protein